MSILKKEDPAQLEALKNIVLDKLYSLTQKKFDDKQIDALSVAFRIFLLKYLNLSYEFTDEELFRELDKRHVNSKLKIRITKLTNHLAEVKFKGRGMSKETFDGLLEEATSIVKITGIEEPKPPEAEKATIFSRIRNKLNQIRLEKEKRNEEQKRLEQMKQIQQNALEPSKNTIPEKKQTQPSDDHDPEMHKLVTLISERGKITLQGAADELDMDENLARECADILEGKGLIKIQYKNNEPLLIPTNRIKKYRFKTEIKESKKVIEKSEVLEKTETHEEKTDQAVEQKKPTEQKTPEQKEKRKPKKKSIEDLKKKITKIQKGLGKSEAEQKIAEIRRNNFSQQQRPTKHPESWMEIENKKMIQHSPKYSLCTSLLFKSLEAYKKNEIVEAQKLYMKSRETYIKLEYHERKEIFGKLLNMYRKLEHTVKEYEKQERLPS